MAEKSVTPRFKAVARHHLRGWRKYRGMTQADLAAETGLSEASISQLENGKQGYSQETLEILAHVLNCRPGDILNRDPTNDDAPWSLWEHLSPEKRKQAFRMIQIIAEDTPALPAPDKLPNTAKTRGS